MVLYVIKLASYSLAVFEMMLKTMYLKNYIFIFIFIFILFKHFYFQALFFVNENCFIESKIRYLTIQNIQTNLVFSVLTKVS